MTKDSKLGCGCITMIVLIIGVYKLIHLWCPGLDFMQMTFFAWVPIILIVGGVHSFFDEIVPTTKSKKQVEEETRREQERQERERREEERRQRELKAQQAYEEWQRVEEEKRQEYEKRQAETRYRQERERREEERRQREFFKAQWEYEERQRVEEENRRAYEKRQAEARCREEKFLRYLFSMLAKLAKADGQVDASEIKVAERAFDRFDFAAQRRKFCVNIFNTAKDNQRSIDWYAEQFASQVDDESVCLFVYELLWDVACADGWLHPKEKEILQAICSKLHISESYYHINYRRRFNTFKEGDRREETKKTGSSSSEKGARKWRRPYVSGRSSLLEAYEFLECEQTATKDELKASYRRLAKRYHPDMLRNNGVPEEMIADATETMAQINAAWEDIRRVRGIG